MARLFLIVALAFAAFGAAPAFAEEPIAYTWEDTLDKRKVNRLVVAFAKQAQADPSDVGSRLKAAQLCYYAWRLEDKDNKRRIEIAKLSLKLAKEVIALNSKHPGGHLWAGAAMAMIGLPRGVLNSLQLVPEGKAYFEKSIENDPAYMNGMAYTLMGHAYHVVPGFPLSIGDKKKAQEYLAKARQSDPGSSMNLLFIADLLWDLGRNQEALEVLAILPTLKPKTELEYFLYTTNKRKADELVALIKSGATRDPLFDVISDIKPGLVN